jgi:tripartite-type tricarboxylate transporter receptor subunit TctC
LGQTIVNVNQPGASGSIGTKSALDAPKDGYTWTAGAAQDLGTYQTLGSLNTSIKDWQPVPQRRQHPGDRREPANALPERQAAAGRDEGQARPGERRHRGRHLRGHNAMELISKVTGVKYRHVTYDGGNPAVVATVAGEAEVTTQLAVEQADMIRGKRLRPLAAVSDKALELEGFGTIEPLSKTLPGFTAPANYFGIFIPKGVPDEVVKTVEKIWAENIVKSEALKKYANSRGALFNPHYGDAAQKGRVPRHPGQCLGAVRRRQDQGVTRYRRYPEAVSWNDAAARTGRRNGFAAGPRRPAHAAALRSGRRQSAGSCWASRC